MLAIVGLFAAAAAPAKIELTHVDDVTTGYATFQSHNQKVLANGRGIFMAHIRSQDKALTAQWRLSRSTDGGRTFATIDEQAHGTYPPAIETDEHDNLYLVRSEFAEGNAYVHAYRATDDYKNPGFTQVPRSAAQKFALCYDAGRKQLYYASHNLFAVIGVDGTLRSSVQLFQNGKHAEMQYPHLSIDPDGVLHVAWTTVPFGKMTYRSIHVMRSPDGGATWRNPDGAPLAPPIVADDTGPAHRVNLDDELEASNWLSNLHVRGGKAHFLYLSTVTPPRQHYVRYDLKTGARDFDVQPKFKGETIALHGLDGFFTASATTLYCVGHTADGRIGCLASDDNGQTWRDHALSEKLDGLYALGGARAVTADGSIIGSFTLAPPAGGGVKVYFLRIPTHP